MPHRPAPPPFASLARYLAAVEGDDDPLVRIWWRALSECERRELLRRAIEERPRQQSA